jgi:Mn2+/Fe2+ NRAMP family transporter
MWGRLFLSPAWVRFLVTTCAVAVPCAVLAFAIVLVGENHRLGPWTIALLTGLPLAFGVLISAAQQRARPVVVDALGDLPAEKWPAAINAASRGPVPADDEVRSAAARMARLRLQRLNKSRRTQVLGAIALTIAAVLQLASLFSAHGRHGAVVPMSIATGYLLAAFGTFYAPRRAAHRAELLSYADELDVDAPQSP